MIEAFLSKLNSIPSDKVAHFASGSVLFALCLPFIAPSNALVLVILAGLLKELYDARHKDTHTPDIWDAVATALGGTLGYFCTFF
jgi:hypothetical protein